MSPFAVHNTRAQNMLLFFWEFNWRHSCLAPWWKPYWRNRQQDSTEDPSPSLGSSFHAEAFSLGLHLSCFAAMPVPAHLLHCSRSWHWPTHWTFHLDCRLICHCVLGWSSLDFDIPCSLSPDLFILHPDLLTQLPGAIPDQPHCCALPHSDCHVDLAVWTLGWTWDLVFP